MPQPANTLNGKSDYASSAPELISCYFSVNYEHEEAVKEINKLMPKHKRFEDESVIVNPLK